MNKSTVVYWSSGTALEREENKDEWQREEEGERSTLHHSVSDILHWLISNTHCKLVYLIKKFTVWLVCTLVRIAAVFSHFWCYLSYKRSRHGPSLLNLHSTQIVSIHTRLILYCATVTLYIHTHTHYSLLSFRQEANKMSCQTLYYIKFLFLTEMPVHQRQITSHPTLVRVKVRTDQPPTWI